jgi:hypothetical protein
MTDINSLVVEPLVRFYRDSSHLIKKCTKPDHRGNGTEFFHLCLTNVKLSVLSSLLQNLLELHVLLVLVS